MNQTRKMWASAAVVGVILVGGVSVAAAASARSSSGSGWRRMAVWSLRRRRPSFVIAASLPNGDGLPAFRLRTSMYSSIRSVSRSSVASLMLTLTSESSAASRPSRP
jgi:hypothetical protein